MGVMGVLRSARPVGHLAWTCRSPKIEGEWDDLAAHDVEWTFSAGRRYEESYVRSSGRYGRMGGLDRLHDWKQLCIQVEKSRVACVVWVHVVSKLLQCASWLSRKPDCRLEDARETARSIFDHDKTIMHVNLPSRGNGLRDAEWKRGARLKLGLKVTGVSREGAA
ncbi:hypothetical protein LA080_002154 [Diaporthe eres]|nr:hypothetical protein LA080_002154 [Diaporthe eres]